MPYDLPTTITPGSPNLVPNTNAAHAAINDLDVRVSAVKAATIAAIGAATGRGELTNIFTNPVPGGTAKWIRFAGTGGVADAGVTDGYYWLKWTTAPTANNAGIGLGANFQQDIPATAGVAYYASVFVFSTVAKSLHLSCDFNNASGGRIGASVRGTVVAVPAATWTKVDVLTGVAPAGVDRLSFSVFPDQALTGSQWAVGNELRARTATVVASTTPVASFNGAMPNGYWTGAPNASTSRGAVL